MCSPAAAAPEDSPQAFITNGSLTETQTMASMPLAASASALLTKLGRWLSEQVGVKAPGTANSATLRPPKMSEVDLGSGPLGPMATKVASGRVSPTAMVMAGLLGIAEGPAPVGAGAPGGRGRRKG